MIYIIILLAAMLIVLIMRPFIIVTVYGDSMANALQDGDRILILRLFPRWMLRQNRIVVAGISSQHYLHALPGNSHFDQSNVPRVIFIIKRVAACPQEWILHEKKQIQLPSRHYYLLSDAEGIDSRQLGTIQQRDIIGIMLLKLHSAPVNHKNIQIVKVQNEQKHK